MSKDLQSTHSRAFASRPTVSVIIPTKNRRTLVEETLNSIRRQTYLQWEAVVVDDGSNDGTSSFMEGLCAQEPRVHYLDRTGENGNANVCRNQGFRKSRGDYIIFLDSDDLLAPHCLEQRVRLMGCNPNIDLAVYPGMCFSSEPGDLDERLGDFSGAGDLDRLLGMHWPMQTTGPIWRRTALDRLGLWDEDLPSWQDVDFHFRAMLARLAMVRCNEPDYYVRTSGKYAKTSAIQQVNRNHFERAVQLFHSLRARLAATCLLTFTRQYMLAGCYLYIAEKEVAVGHVFNAFRHWREARREALVWRRVYIVGLAYLLCVWLKLDRVWPLRNRFYLWKWKWRLTRGRMLF